MLKRMEAEGAGKGGGGVGEFDLPKFKQKKCIFREYQK